MAGDWIPWGKGLTRKQEVLQIARDTGRDRRQVAALLMEFWEWADGETDNGTLNGASFDILREMVHGTDEAFWLAVVKAGWLKVTPEGIELPNFADWMGKSGKARLKEAKKKRRQRGDVPILSPKNGDKSGTTGQDSTELGDESPNNPSCSDPAENGRTEPEPSENGDSLFHESEPDCPARQGNARAARKASRGSGTAVPEDDARDPAVLVFPVVGGGATEWTLRQSKLAEYAASFPGVDVPGEARKALQWCRDNPTKRKTPRGMTKFLCGWMERAQNRAALRVFDSSVQRPSTFVPMSQRIKREAVSQ